MVWPFLMQVVQFLVATIWNLTTRLCCIMKVLLSVRTLIRAATAVSISITQMQNWSIGVPSLQSLHWFLQVVAISTMMNQALLTLQDLLRFRMSQTNGWTMAYTLLVLSSVRILKKYITTADWQWQASLRWLEVPAISCWTVMPQLSVIRLNGTLTTTSS